MERAPAAEKQWARMAVKAVRAPLSARVRKAIAERRRRLGIALPLVVAIELLLLAPSASAATTVVCSLGSGAGQCNGPSGVAVDTETGRLFVADKNNNRVDVFDSADQFQFSFGTAGQGKGQFNRPTAIAVDNSPTSASRHDVYVVDRDNRRIEKFDPEGNFILAFGGGVDQTTSGDVCTAESGNTCGAGSDGFTEGEFTINESIGRTEIFVGVGPSGVVYVVDSLQEGSSFKEARCRLQKFEPSGTEIAPQHILFEEGSAYSLAVDSTGDFYLGNGGEAIRKYDSGGAEIDKIESSFGGGANAVGATLAVDAAGNLFAASFGVGPEVNILEFDPTGNPLRRFGYGSFQGALSGGGLAPYHSSSGDIYASEPEAGVENGSRLLHIDFPQPGPLVFPKPCQTKPGTLGNAKATLQAEVNPEGKATTYHFEYIAQQDFEENGNSFSGAHAATRLPELAAEDPVAGSDFHLHEASLEAALVPETEYRCRAIAANADLPAGVTGQEGTFTSLPPLEIGHTWATEVGTEAATLHAEVNPLGIPTSAYFEYVDEATYLKDIEELGPGHGFDHATKAPAGEPLDFGAGESFKAGEATISGLTPGTAYRYRIVATDVKLKPLGKEIPGPTEALRTFAPGEGGLPDGRAYELVSPAQTGGADVAVPFSAGGFFSPQVVRIEAAAGSGEALTYTSWTSFGEPEGAPGASQYLSRRTAAGWATENVSPSGTQRFILQPAYRGFTGDLGFGAYVVFEPPLTAEAQPGIENLYLRDDGTGTLQALTIEAPQFTPGEGISFDSFCTTYAGASTDGKHAFFAANGAMAGAPEGVGFSLYEWSAAGLGLLSVLPDGNPAQPTKGTHFGAEGGTPCAMDQGIVAHAVSADGQTAFWSYGGKYINSERPLFARIDGVETIQLDAKVAGEKNGGKGVFWAAGADGSKAFFTAPGKLTADAKAEGELYRYDTLARSRTDLTPGAIAPEVEGVIGASEDGSYAYFVAKAALSGEEVGAGGEKAVKGANNLYLWHEGEGLRFIAALGSEPIDEQDWSSEPTILNASLSPDGRSLAFLSTESEALSGYDNTIAAGAHCQPAREGGQGLDGDPLCPQAYLYDVEADTLACASCNPSGARPLGPAQLPFWSNPYEGPRYLAEDGSRLYFESRDALTLADENERRDVYEFERAGKGTCTSESPAFDPSSGGCHFLISSGKGTDESYLVDASASGRDAFFSTREALLGWDANENYDVYDAREGGGFPEPSPAPPICAGEACLPPSPAPPSPSSSPPTANFQGPGNAVHKLKKRHRKVKKHRRHHRRSSHNARAAR